MFSGLSKCETININCEFDTKTYRHLKDLETCTVVSMNQVNQENMNIRLFPADSRPNSHKNVEGFSAIDKEIFFFPAKISSIFPYLKAFTVKNSKLRKVTSTNLKELKYLEFLDLSYNKLIILDANLFKNNQNLTTILLNNNNLYYIDGTAFNDLKNLKSVNQNDNICYSSTLTSLQQVLEAINSSYCNSGFIKSSDLQNLSFEYNFTVEVIQKQQKSSEFSGSLIFMTIFMLVFCYLFILLIMYLIHQSNKSE